MPRSRVFGGSILASIGVGSTPDPVIYAAGYIWVGNRGSNTVSKIDPSTSAVTATITVSGSPVRMAYDGTYVWVSHLTGSGIARINATTNAVVLNAVTAASAQAVAGLAYDGASMWCDPGTSVVKFDQSGATIVSATGFATGGDAMIAAGGFGWRGNSGNTIEKFDLGTGARITGYALGGTNVGVEMATDGTYLYVPAFNGTVITRITIATGALATATIPASCGGCALYEGLLYASQRGGNTVTIIDPTSMAVLDKIAGFSAPAQMAVDAAEHLWVANFSAANSVSKVQLGRAPSGARSAA